MLERIRVLHVIGGGEFGGAEQHLLTLIKHMDRSEFAIHVACLFPEPLAPLVKNDGIPVHIFPMKSKINLKPVGEIASLIKLEGFHIVHTHGVRANLVGRLAAKLAGVRPVVTTVHSVLAFDYNRWYDRWVNAVCERVARNITDKFIAVSDALGQRLAAEGVPAGKIVTVYNGLELAKYDPETPGLPVRKEFGISPGAVVAGIIARLHPVKGHKYLLEAFAEAGKKYSDLFLLIVGAGYERDRLEDRANKLGISERVIFTGFRRDITHVIAALDFLVLPSLSEGLGIVIMEAMSMKKPVIASRVGGIPEVITPGVDGLLVPPADVPALVSAIELLAGDRRMVSVLGEAARETAQTRFSAEIMGKKTAMIYKDILKQIEVREL